MSSGCAELADWNNTVLDLVAALRGVISPNMRMIVLSHDGTRWRFLFVLEHDDPTDREEIEDVPSEFEALQSGPVDCAADVQIANGPLPWPAHPARVIYRRRERSGDSG